MSVSRTAKDADPWRGVHISQLPKCFEHPQFPDLVNNAEHTVLIETPLISGSVPKSCPPVSHRRDYWDINHVKLPCSEKSVTRNNRKRWDVIREALTRFRIQSGQELEAAIFSYNSDYAERLNWNFTTLRSFLHEVLTVEERKTFFSSLLPKIIDLALQLPELITDGIPLLQQNRSHSISLSQVQIACLLANAFLCTYPYRNEGKKTPEYVDYRAFNFEGMFQCGFQVKVKSVQQKLRCLLHYFKRVTDNVPTGVVTFSRHSVSPNAFPNWATSDKTLTRLYVSSVGNIEDDGYGCFQMDFADKFIGGLITTTGCVQEEIRFVICPELIVSRLFTQVMAENEAVIITGCERFSSYKGYDNSFTWTGDYIDETPRDQYGRRYCTVLALDALNFRWKPAIQFLPKSITREMNKAYAGFSWRSSFGKRGELCPVATGNWGCGIFRGNVQLKSLLQLMAAAEADRDLAYFTFNDVKLKNSLASMHQYLVDNRVTIGKLYKLLMEYDKFSNSISVFDFIRQRVTAAKQVRYCDLKNIGRTLKLEKMLLQSERSKVTTGDRRILGKHAHKKTDGYASKALKVLVFVPANIHLN